MIIVQTEDAVPVREADFKNVLLENSSLNTVAGEDVADGSLSDRGGDNVQSSIEEALEVVSSVAVNVESASQNSGVANEWVLGYFHWLYVHLLNKKGGNDLTSCWNLLLVALL